MEVALSSSEIANGLFLVLAYACGVVLSGESSCWYNVRSVGAGERSKENPTAPGCLVQTGPQWSCSLWTGVPSVPVLCWLGHDAGAAWSPTLQWQQSTVLNNSVQDWAPLLFADWVSFWRLGSECTSCRKKGFQSKQRRPLSALVWQVFTKWGIKTKRRNMWPSNLKLCMPCGWWEALARLHCSLLWVSLWTLVTASQRASGKYR